MAFALVGCTGPNSNAATTPTSQKVDQCIVGRWILTSQSFTDTITVPGVTLVGTGGAGEVDTYSADGHEVIDLTNASPYIESGGGHSYTYTDRGIARFTMDAKNGTWSESGPDQTLTFKDVVLDGTMQPDASAPVPPGAGTYRCSGSSLTWMRTIPFSGTATEKRA